MLEEHQEDVMSQNSKKVCNSRVSAKGRIGFAVFLGVFLFFFNKRNLSMFRC